ncbi:MAG: hypothetical protein EOO74_03165 [Myxococcales bacterium]|nr:MAG: hypothetical protein EOO74_03165 [Myxococcales bacterium]
MSDIQGQINDHLDSAAPRSVDLARLMVYVTVAWLAIRTLLAIIFKDNLIDGYIDQTSSGLPEEVLREGAPNYTAIALISLIIFGGLLLLCAFKFASRANWARIVAIVFSALTLIGGLLGFAQKGIPTWYLLTGLVSSVIAAGVIWFLVQKDSNAWFKGA